MSAISLFASCAVAGCRNDVTDPRDVCPECRAAFGDMLIQSDRPAPSVEDFVADRVAGVEQVRRILRERAQIVPVDWKANQRCWCCEERRTCRPDGPGRMLCRACETVQ